MKTLVVITFMFGGMVHAAQQQITQESLLADAIAQDNQVQAVVVPGQSLEQDNAALCHQLCQFYVRRLGIRHNDPAISSLVTIYPRDLLAAIKRYIEQRNLG